MRFKIDENLPPTVADVLAAEGHNAATVNAENLSGAVDDEIARVCQQEDRALITLDLDFADITTYPPTDFSGLIVFRLKSQDVPHVLDMVRRLLPVLGSEQLEGTLWIVDEERIRIRS